MEAYMSGLFDFLFNAHETAKEGRWLRSSVIFDQHWYLAQNADVAAARVDPVLHYLKFGAREGRRPGPLFDAAFYLSQNPDVAKSGVNPLLHYCRNGAEEGRDPNPLFDTDWYVHRHMIGLGSDQNPLVHFACVGAAAGYDPSPSFDVKWYCQQNPDVVDAGLNPLGHYLTIGIFQGRLPQSPAAYRARNVGRADTIVESGGHFKTDGDPQVLRAKLQGHIEQLSMESATPFYPLLGELVKTCGEVGLHSIRSSLNEPVSIEPTQDRSLVSVIMPVYNRREVLADALNSVLSQSYPAFELIICDDGSDDGSAEIVTACKDPRAKLIRLDHNQGAAAARNRALKAARGLYIAYLDSDNIWHPHYCLSWLPRSESGLVPRLHMQTFLKSLQERVAGSFAPYEIAASTSIFKYSTLTSI